MTSYTSPHKLPGALDFYRGREKRFLKQVRLVLRFWLRRPFFYSEALRLNRFLNEHKIWIPLFEESPLRFHAVIYHYLDKRFSPKERVDQIECTFSAMEKILGPHLIETLVREGTVVLAQLNERLTLNLNLNNIDYLEGYFSINIQDGTTKRYYDASFGIIDQNRLLVASIQGPKGEQAQELVRQLTKDLHGMRPMFFMVDVLKLLAQAWGMTLCGIPYKRQVKIRLHGSKKVFFNYDEYWQENEGHYENEYWVMPTTLTRRPLEEIQSKKRSMYKKRYAMLDAVMAGIDQYFPAQK